MTLKRTIFCVIIILYVIFIAYKGRDYYDKLDKYGVYTTGTVIKIIDKGNHGYEALYEFEYNGQTVRGSVNCDPATDHVEIGKRYTVKYCKIDKGINEMYLNQEK